MARLKTLLMDMKKITIRPTAEWGADPMKAQLFPAFFQDRCRQAQARQDMPMHLFSYRGAILPELYTLAARTESLLQLHAARTRNLLLET